MGNIVVGGILAVIVLSVLARLIRNKKKGKSSCGCGCSSCGEACSCHSEK